MDSLSRLFVRLRSSPRRAVLVEIAFIAPAMALILSFTLCQLCYFRLSSQIQQTADRALAAAQRAPDDATRESRARTAVQDELARLGLAPRVVEVTLQGPAHDLSVILTYDASTTPIFALNAFMPMPSATIIRLAKSNLRSR
jgi:Flp pilus assembly protein TadG